MFEVYEIKSKPYIGVTAVAEAIGTKFSNLHHYIKKDRKLEKQLIHNYNAPGRKHPITIMSIDGVKMLLPIVQHLGDADMYVNVSDWVETNSVQKVVEQPVVVPTEVLPATVNPTISHGSDISDWSSPGESTLPVEVTTPHDHGEEGRMIFREMFHDKMVEFRKINGETWLVARDIYKAFGINRVVFYGVIDRIRDINTEYVRIDTTPSNDSVTLSSGKNERNRNPKRILLNKNGITLLLNEINISRLKNEETRKQLIEFKSWVATIVGDTLSGDLKVTKADEPTVVSVVKTRTPRMISDKRFASISSQEYSTALWLMVSGQIPPFECCMTALEHIQSRSGIETTGWRNLVEKHREKMSICLPPPTCNINTDHATTKSDGNNGGSTPTNNFVGVRLPSVINTMNFGKQEKEIVLKAKAIVAAMEQHGVNPNALFKDAENILANYN